MTAQKSQLFRNILKYKLWLTYIVLNCTVDCSGKHAVQRMHGRMVDEERMQMRSLAMMVD